MTEGPPVKDRKRGQKNSGFLESMGIDLSNLNLQITLNPEDKELIQSALKEMSDKVDYRWKVTQLLMLTAILLSGGAQVANWVVFGA